VARVGEDLAAGPEEEDLPGEEAAGAPLCSVAETSVDLRELKR
jgi:hypothetical protein